MDSLNKFRSNLRASNTPASNITIKNYVSDVKKFILWFESTFQYPFPPSAIPKEVVDKYLNEIIASSPRSAKRYSSSLRKFFAYLVSEAKLTYNPLDLKPKSTTSSDPWHLNDFKNFLYTDNASSVTIKNYLNDIRQFLSWAQGVGNQTDVFAKINTFMLEEYKNVLLNEAKMSPLSVNRKLSSLRKYLTWATDKGLLRNQAEINSLEKTKDSKIYTKELPLQALQDSAPKTDGKTTGQTKSSKFAPFRLFNAITTGFNLVLDGLVILSIVKAIEAIKYNFWKATGANTFAPVSKVLESINGLPDAEIPHPNPLSPIDKFITRAAQFDASKVRTIPKSTYAPHKISVASLSFWKKIIYHIKHTRPNWYKRYHSYSYAHYLHFAIVILVSSAMGFAAYQGLRPPVQKAVLSERTKAQSRFISFKGRLYDDANTPIVKQTVVKFAIYDSQTGETSLVWQEAQKITPDVNGDFEAQLGKIKPISQDLFTNYPRLYLGLSIGSGPELTPRQELATVELSRNAQALQGLLPITTSGAGTNNVILALDSLGNLTIGGAASPTFQATGGEFRLSGQTLTLFTNEGSNTNVQISPDGTGIIDLRKPLQNTSNNNNLSSALGAVEVDDNFAILASSSAQSAFYINQNSTGDLISASSSGIAKFTVDNQGSASFAGDVSILGNNLNTSATTFNIANKNTLILNIGQAATEINIASSSGITTINNELKVGKKLHVLGELQLTLAGSQTSSALCGSHPAGTGQNVSDITVVDCIGTPAADYMEIYPAKQGLELGDIAAPSNEYTTTKDGDRLSKLEKSSKPYQNTIIGIISDKNKAGDFNSIGHNISASDNPLPIALNGRVPVKIDPSSDPIEPGDYLTTSGVSGRAMKAKKAGIMVGKALESWDGQDKIMVFVNISWFDPTPLETDQASVSSGELPNSNFQIPNSILDFLQALQLGTLELQHLTLNSLSIATENVTIGGQSLRDYIVGIVNEVVDRRLAEREKEKIVILSPVVNVEVEPEIASPSATPTPSLSPTPSASPSANPTPTSPVTASASAGLEPENVATESAVASPSVTVTPTPAPDKSASPEADIRPEFATFEQGLISLGPVSLADTAISTQLNIGTNLTIDQTSINTLETSLSLQPLRQADLSIMGGLITIDTQGNLRTSGNATFEKDVTIKGKLAAGIIAPIPDEDLIFQLNNSSLVVKDASGSAVLSINNSGDVTASGSGKFKDIITNSLKIVRGVSADTSFTETIASGSAGTATITAYETERTIVTPFVHEDSLIYITPVSASQSVSLYIARQTIENPNAGTRGSFTIQIPQTLKQDMKFNWIIIN